MLLVYRNASGGQMLGEENNLGGVVWRSEEDHSAPMTSKGVWLIPESPTSVAPDREADPKGGRGSGMLDLDAFQKSTPYALVTEWLIPRYAGSRLIRR